MHHAEGLSISKKQLEKMRQKAIKGDLLSDHIVYSYVISSKLSAHFFVLF